MSVDTHINFGPYLVVTTKKQSVDVDVRSCPNKKCKEHQKELSGKFCATCGATIQNVTVSRVNDLSPEEVLEEYEDSLVVQNSMGSPLNGMKKNQEVLLSNTSSPFDKDRKFPDPDYGGVSDLENLDVQGEKAWFVKHHEKEIALLEAAYGKNNVQLKYGIVISHS
jgi:hypothetical protein